MTPRMKLISFWLSLIGFLMSIYGLAENRKLYALSGLLFFTSSILLAFKLLSIKKYIKKTNTVIDGRRIDALNVANINRNPNKSLKVQEATHFIKVKGNNLFLRFEYSGYCRDKKGENGFVFSVDSDVNIPFEKLVCHGFDLINDPSKNHEIRPFLSGSDGLAKIIKLPFNNPVFKGDQFHVALFCELPGCIKFGKYYISATLAFKDDINIKEFSVKLEFVKNHPKWVRLYDATSGEPQLIKDLKPKCQKSASVHYEDKYKNIESEKAFIYLFER